MQIKEQDTFMTLAKLHHKKRTGNITEDELNMYTVLLNTMSGNPNIFIKILDKELYNEQ